MRHLSLEGFSTWLHVSKTMKQRPVLCPKLSSDVKEQSPVSFIIEFTVGWIDWIGLNARSLSQFKYDNMNLLRIQALKLQNNCVLFFLNEKKVINMVLQKHLDVSNSPSHPSIVHKPSWQKMYIQTSFLPDGHFSNRML